MKLIKDSIFTLMCAVIAVPGMKNILLYRLITEGP